MTLSRGDNGRRAGRVRADRGQELRRVNVMGGNLRVGSVLSLAEGRQCPFLVCLFGVFIGVPS